MPNTMTEAQIERESVEAVFSLGGGELDDKPLTYTIQGETEERTFFYHYDGPPEYAGSDFPDKDSSEVADYFTVVGCWQYGNPPTEIIIKGKRYVQAGSYLSSGETECTATQCDPDPFDGERCPLCDRDVGDEHGCIYLGDGWAEVVYRHDVVAHMREVARTHNLQVWEAREYKCETCGASQPAGDTFEHLTDCEDMAPGGRGSHVTHKTKLVWWWQSCSPGCLPDSEAMGPFDSEREALEDATEGLDDA